MDPSNEEGTMAEKTGNALARAAHALTADLESGEPGPWPPEVWTQLHALIQQSPSQLAHMGMNYRCEKCAFEWLVYLTIGLEGPEPLKSAGLALPVPFVIGCPSWAGLNPPEAEPRGMTPCEGSMTHIDWARDEVYAPLVLIPDDAPRFVMPESAIGDNPPCGRLALPTPAFVRGRRGGAPDAR